MNSKTATVETLTAEVQVLMIGSRQVTMSVYNQLDWAELDKIELFGRVRPREAQRGIIYLVGKTTDTGQLVRSRALTESMDTPFRSMWENKIISSAEAERLSALPLIVLAGLR